jgi:UrcA family protein
MRNLALILAPLAVLAAPVAAAPAETISHGDIDLTTKAGVEQFNRRIETKIRGLCETGTPGVVARQYEQQCRAVALAEARTKARIAIAEANANKARLAEATPASRSTNPGA